MMHTPRPHVFGLSLSRSERMALRAAATASRMTMRAFLREAIVRASGVSTPDERQLVLAPSDVRQERLATVLGAEGAR